MRIDEILLILLPLISAIATAIAYFLPKGSRFKTVLNALAKRVKETDVDKIDDKLLVPVTDLDFEIVLEEFNSAITVRSIKIYDSFVDKLVINAEKKGDEELAKVVFIVWTWIKRSPSFLKLAKDPLVQLFVLFSDVIHSDTNSNE